MQNFTPIGITVAEISVSEQIDRITADKTHTSVAFVDEKLNQYKYPETRSLPLRTTCVGHVTSSTTNFRPHPHDTPLDPRELPAVAKLVHQMLYGERVLVIRERVHFTIIIILAVKLD